jgi:putative transposase
MHGVNLTYALFYQRHYQYRGHLWQDRFKSLLIDRERSLLACGRYVELHPVRGGLVKDPREYAWSSYRVYAEGAGNPTMTPNPLYEAMGLTAQARQREYRELIQRGMHQAPAAPLDRYRFIGGTTASMRSLEECFGIPGIRRRRGRPRNAAIASLDGRNNSTVPNVSNRGSDEK